MTALEYLNVEWSARSARIPVAQQEERRNAWQDLVKECVAQFGNDETSRAIVMHVNRNMPGYGTSSR